jgi:hypothetical protein
MTSETLRFVDRQVGKRARSRSGVIESLIQTSRQRDRDQELSRLAREFFASPPTPEEDQERAQWLELSMETQRHDR